MHQAIILTPRNHQCSYLVIFFSFNYIVWKKKFFKILQQDPAYITYIHFTSILIVIFNYIYYNIPHIDSSRLIGFRIMLELPHARVLEKVYVSEDHCLLLSTSSLWPLLQLIFYSKSCSSIRFPMMMAMMVATTYIGSKQTYDYGSKRCPNFILSDPLILFYIFFFKKPKCIKKELQHK